jgi:hypothetical protein
MPVTLLPSPASELTNSSNDGQSAIAVSSDPPNVADSELEASNSTRSDLPDELASVNQSEYFSGAFYGTPSLVGDEYSYAATDGDADDGPILIDIYNPVPNDESNEKSPFIGVSTDNSSTYDFRYDETASPTLGPSSADQAVALTNDNLNIPSQMPTQLFSNGNDDNVSVEDPDDDKTSLISSNADPDTDVPSDASTDTPNDTSNDAVPIDTSADTSADIDPHPYPTVEPSAVPSTAEGTPLSVVPSTDSTTGDVEPVSSDPTVSSGDGDADTTNTWSVTDSPTFEPTFTPSTQPTYSLESHQPSSYFSGETLGGTPLPTVGSFSIGHKVGKSLGIAGAMMISMATIVMALAFVVMVSRVHNRWATQRAIKKKATEIRLKRWRHYLEVDVNDAATGNPLNESTRGRLYEDEPGITQHDLLHHTTKQPLPV